MKRINTEFLERTFFFCVAILILASCSKNEKRFFLSDWQFSEGDIVFRRGIGAKSTAVLRVDKEGLYSHVGIIVKLDSVFMVVHITPGEREKGETEDRIKIEAPELFFCPFKAQSGAVIRLKDSLEYAEMAAHEAYRLFQQVILFDHNYLLEDTTKMYCTELIWRSYLSGNKDITQGRRSVLENFPLFSGTYIFPSDIYVNDEFSLIYNY